MTRLVRRPAARTRRRRAGIVIPLSRSPANLLGGAPGSGAGGSGMAIHYFHCTDGVDLILDREGRETKAVQDTITAAHDVADEIMRAVPAYREWDNWAVHIYDEAGPLDVVPFAVTVREAA
jgi:hypothetical protein